MADNKLVSDPVNALTATASKYPAYQDLLKFLGSNQPSIRFADLGPETKGEYEYGPRYGNAGEIRVNKNSLRDIRPYTAESNARTLIHETTHATDRQLDKLFSDYQGNPPTPEMAQFVDAYRKLRWNATRPNANFQSSPSEALARRLDPEWARKNAGYRAHTEELYGHAVGNVARTPGDKPYSEFEVPLHLDPTLATEHFILLDIANRAQKSLLPK